MGGRSGGSAAKPRPASPPGQQNSYAADNAGYAGSSVSSQKPVAEDDSWLNAAGSVVYSLIAGGRQCCSMRDRTADTEAARRASEQGRPPEAQSNPGSFSLNTGPDRDVAFPPPSAERLQASRQREAPSQEFALRPQGN